MIRRRFINLMCMALLLLLTPWVMENSFGQGTGTEKSKLKQIKDRIQRKKIIQEERKAAGSKPAE
ncbi:MAG: hypothetical protein ACE15F_23605 [bacterium]